MPPLNIVLFLDGRPGHEKQSRGLVAALRNYLDCRLEERMVQGTGFWSRGMDYLRLLSLVPVSTPIAASSTLALGTGSATHLPLLDFKRRSGSRAITCMNPGRLLRPRFDLCFIPFHDQVKTAANVFQTIGPPNPVQFSDCHDHYRGLILIGGENRLTRPWEPALIARQVAEVIKRSACTKWTVSSSPRTPAPVEEALATLCHGADQANFTPYRESPPGWVEAHYAEAGEVWVTGDSISMVYEALTAGCRVGVLPVAWKSGANKFTLSLEMLCKNGQVITLDQLSRDHSDWGAAPPLDEADRCARELLKRWWPESLR